MPALDKAVYDVLIRERDEVDRVLRERQAQLTVALNAIASIAADLKLTTGPSADWVGDTTRAIRAAVSAQQAALRDIATAVGVADGTCGEIVSEVRGWAEDRTAAEHPPAPRTDPATGQPMAGLVTCQLTRAELDRLDATAFAQPELGKVTAAVLRGLRAMACSLTAPQAEHPDVQTACRWIAGEASR